MTDLRVALAGYGLAGKVFHAPLIAATPGLALSAVITSNPERQADLRVQHPGAAVIESTDALFARPDDFDLMVIATTNAAHLPLHHLHRRLRRIRGSRSVACRVVQR